MHSVGPCIIIIGLAAKASRCGDQDLRMKTIRYYSQILIPAEIQCLSNSTVSRCGEIWLDSAVVPVMIPFAARWEAHPQETLF